MQFDSPPPAKGRPLTVAERKRLYDSPHPYNVHAWCATRPDGRVQLLYPSRGRFIVRVIT